MGKITGFQEYKREDLKYESVKTRITHFKEFAKLPSQKNIQNQGARCMDCGVPFCHSSFGCPLANIIPQFNDEVYKNKDESAFKTLMSTNNFPEFTGRVCPAICEGACVLGLNEKAVTIKNIELYIIEKAYKKGWMKPKNILCKTGKKIAIIGSGPAGLAVADELNSKGHAVTVFEKEKRVGGLLRYGIPNFKLDKKDVVQKRVDLMSKEGVIFKTGICVGQDIQLSQLENEFDAVVICVGAGKPRDLIAKNRDAKGIYFAMDFLSMTNSSLEGEIFEENKLITAKDKSVLVIGGGDTGSDCVGTSIRQNAKSVTQIELLPQPPKTRDSNSPWPTFPKIFKLSTSQEEGCELQFCVLTKSFNTDAKGNVTGANCVKIEWQNNSFKEIENSEFEIKADLVLLAMGFVGIDDTSFEAFSADIEIDAKRNIQSSNYQTKNPKIFACGDARRGQSLIVWAIAEGRECANTVDSYLS